MNDYTTRIDHMDCNFRESRKPRRSRGKYGNDRQSKQSQISWKIRRRTVSANYKTSRTRLMFFINDHETSIIYLQFYLFLEICKHFKRKALFSPENTGNFNFEKRNIRNIFYFSGKPFFDWLKNLTQKLPQSPYLGSLWIRPCESSRQKKY